MNFTKVGISYFLNPYVPNSKATSYDSKNIWLLGKIPKNISLRVLSGILPKLEFHIFGINICQIVKQLHMIPKIYGC